ncbi:MAG TPA: choice-of-anchor D domain-containing protein [Terriglobia bacterium]|nr:choice-of-anchor D domain-containing protein [Terriglobia bacterium]
MLSKALRQQVFKTANLLAIIFAFAVSALTGAGAVPAKVSLTSLSFGNVHQRTASTAKTITFYNEEAVPLTITSIATGNTDFTETNTCGQSLAAKSNCTITVTFTPSLVGAETGTLSVTDAASNSPQTATLTGTGTAQVKISPASLTFAAQTAGTTSATKNVTVTNNLSTALTIFIRFAGANPGDFSQTNTCGSKVAAGGTCTISTKFEPSASGTRTAALSVADSAGGSLNPVSLSGTGMAPVVTLSPANLSFANQYVGTTSAAQTLTLTNTGTASLTKTSIAITGSNASEFAKTSTCGSSVAAGANCTLTLTFTPSATGNRAASLSISDNATGSPQLVSLSGTGTSLLLSVSPTSASFGNVVPNSTASLPLVLTNTGTGSVTISQATVTGTGFAINNLSLPLTLSAGQYTSFNVTFAPSGTGSASGRVSIVSNTPNSPTGVNLSGTGTDSAPQPSACVGSEITQTPVDVTSLLSSVAPGITVTQLTDNSGASWNTYADIPAFSSPTNAITYNYGANPNAVATAALDGTAAQVISGNAQGTQVQVTMDGQFAYYQGQNPKQSADIYAVPLTASGDCQPVRLSQLNMKFVAPAQALIISTSSLDPATGHNVVAFSEGTILHRVLDDGTALPDLTLPDPENTDVFHRMRLNPVFPNILWYKRDDPAPNPNGKAQTEIWVIDLNNPDTVYSLSGSTGPKSAAIDHASWSNDGTKLGYIYNGYWWIANVLNADGTFNFNARGAFTLTRVGPSASSGFTVDFCTLSPDSSVYVCAESYQAIYLMSLDGTQTKFLASPDSNSSEAIYNGIPKPRFLDMQHIMFSSDRTGAPQVYVITGFTTTFP